ncbi:MAG: hypothetical protein ACI9K2_003106 [Myxococcota bacterium]
MIALLAVAALADRVPAIVDVTEALARAEDVLARADAAGVAVGRLQQRWWDHAGCTRESAADAARMRILGAAWRDALQSARVAESEVGDLATAPTVAPLLPVATRDRVGALAAEVQANTARWAVAGAFHARFVEPPMRSCDGGLEPGPGLGAFGPAAVIVLDGELCPPAPRIGRVAIVVRPSCVAPDAGCDCEPSLLAPGAVLAP